jgi:hypothetical protein
MRIIERLARHYENGMTARRASLETGLLLSHVRAQYRDFHALGLPRRTRRILIMDFYSRPAPYCGPTWIGEAIGEPPVPTGPEWIGQPINS